MSWRRDDTDSQDSQAALAPGKTIISGSPGVRMGPNVETQSLWVPIETRPALGKVVHSLRGLAMLLRIMALASLSAVELSFLTRRFSRKKSLSCNECTLFSGEYG